MASVRSDPCKLYVFSAHSRKSCKATLSGNFGSLIPTAVMHVACASARTKTVPSQPSHSQRSFQRGYALLERARRDDMAPSKDCFSVDDAPVSKHVANTAWSAMRATAITAILALSTIETVDTTRQCWAQIHSCTPVERHSHLLRHLHEDELQNVFFSVAQLSATLLRHDVLHRLPLSGSALAKRREAENLRGTTPDNHKKKLTNTEHHKHDSANSKENLPQTQPPRNDQDYAQCDTKNSTDDSCFQHPHSLDPVATDCETGPAEMSQTVLARGCHAATLCPTASRTQCEEQELVVPSHTSHLNDQKTRMTQRLLPILFFYKEGNDCRGARANHGFPHHGTGDEVRFLVACVSEELQTTVVHHRDRCDVLRRRKPNLRSQNYTKHGANHPIIARLIKIGKWRRDRPAL